MHLDFLYTAVSWVLLRWYQLFTFLRMSKTSGLTWALSIVMLVVTARLLMFRFFVKQVHYQRRMQEMQPKIKKLQEKHKGDRATLQREMMALQQAEGFNPISGCLPMFLQIPVFIALFHVLKHMSNSVNLKPGNPKLSLYGFTESQTLDAAKAKLFTAPLAASLHETSQKIHDLGGHVTTTRLVTLILVLVSAAATLVTQRAVIANQTTPAEGQAAMIQKLMMVGIPISVIFSGFIFPLGVLLYWFTSNLWTMFQQFYIFKFHPHTPGVTADAVAAAGTARASAPKVGQKPVHPKGSRPAVTPNNTSSDKISLDKDDGSPNGRGAANDRGAPNGSAASNGRVESNGKPDDGSSATPRPGARPNRPSGNRPGNKRSPSKKRR